jgi:LPS-assembly protein
MKHPWLTAILAARRHRPPTQVKRARILVLLVALAVAAASPGFAQGPYQGQGDGKYQGKYPGKYQGKKRGAKKAPDRVEPYLILRADEVTYEEKTGASTASGNVEISHGQRLLRADKVTYQEKTDTFTATGNVALVEPDGEVIFGEHAKFTQQFKDGFIKAFRMLFKDNSRLAAVGGRRIGGQMTVLDKAVYSPCELCRENPDRAPLWRLRSVRVIHDGVRKDIEYRDVTLELFGIPVIYIPYLSHPDPTVKRRSGILAPAYSNDSDLGLNLAVPYFWEISPSEDVTITPVIYSKVAPLLAAEYNRRFAHGKLSASGSITYPEEEDGNGSKVRGHILAKAEFDLDPIWRAGFQVQHASDDTYLRRYGFDAPSEQTLTTSFNIEGFKGHSYATLSGYHFQGLREEDDPDVIPLVLPFAQYSYTSGASNKGAYFTANASILALQRDQGADSRRISIKGGWHLPYTSKNGDVFELSATLKGDLYWVDDVETGGGKTESGLTGRLFPQIMAKWRYPFVRREKRGTQLIEPMVAIVIAPNGGNPSKIPNEDSQDIVFDDTNLFSPNRFTGEDRVEGGQRLIYGINWGLYGDQGGAVEAFLGQSYRLQSEPVFSEDSGLRDQASHLVGRIRIAPADYLDFLYRFRIDPRDLNIKRSEAKLSVGPSWFRADLNYLFVNEDAGSGEFGDREEISAGLKVKLGKFWTAKGNIREDLTEDGGSISHGVGFTYKDECIIFDASFERSFTEDRDLKPKDTVFFRVIFKNLGEIRT